MDPFVSRASGKPYHHRWTRLNQDEPPETALESPLLDLGHSSDVDPLLPEQVAEARQVLRLRHALVDEGRTERRETVLAGQRRIVERFLAGRRGYFGDEQSRPLPDVPALVREGRDVFVVVKFMDEAPHLRATLSSLAHQDFDMGRVVVLLVDNNSTDGSEAIAKGAATDSPGAARVVYLPQPMAGAGNAARLGVDTAIATVYEMCRHDGQWERLQTATIAVSDGDTVYHPDTLASVARILEEQPTVDGVMPFLTYKFTAALRLFHDYRPAFPEALERRVNGTPPTRVPVGLATMDAHAAFPRGLRWRDGDTMVLTTRDGGTFRVPLDGTDEHGRRFGVLTDPRGCAAYVLEDRTLVLAEAPVSGFDAALVFLENGGVRPDEKWRWHAVVGHDLFLYWAFRHMGLPESAVFPDSSDAMKTFRVWSFAIGGQHQLRRRGLRIATGSDYQSGRVLQTVGCALRLGPAEVFAETETDRLIKMVRNFVHRQTVFYGETRAAVLERATGLYVHMTRIQGEIERELLEYDDEVFADTVFPERVLFPLRWILQNAIRFYAHGEEEREVVRERVLRVMFRPGTAGRIEREILTDEALQAFAEIPHADRQVLAERLAETVIATHHAEIMAFYATTLRSFFAAHDVPSDRTAWLLDGLKDARNALAERPPEVDPAAVWDGPEFEIDEARGQVVSMRRRTLA
ncbi:glycosyltransferase family A protein [Actinoallomurus sp. NPDC050550]|uniref:glycosyltransferase family A protein n=1 Tax=Actinoallomurus sp. NPDC050550 TaxID=3154937 RepID=UPI0033F96A12